MNHRAAVLSLALSAALVGCPPTPEGTSGDGAASGEMTAVQIQLNWLPEPQFGGVYAAQLSGAFERHGLKVTIRKGGADVPAVQMTASGQVEFGLAAADEVLRIREQGAKVVSLFATYQTAPQGIMTPRRRGLTSLEQLLTSEGTLAVQPGLAYVELFKTRYELKAKLVTYQGGISQFLAQQEANFAQQCFVTSEPISARREGVESDVFLIADSGYNPYTSVVITHTETLETQPDLCRRMTAALREGWEAYLDDPGPANEHMQTLNPSLDAETFLAAAEAQRPLIETEATKATGLGSMSLERWEQLRGQLVELKIIKGDVQAADCFVTLD